jgi:hypothetical protein
VKKILGLRCSFCNAILPEDVARIRKKGRKKNKSGKIFCGHTCRIKYFYPDEVRHGGSKVCHTCKQEKPKSEFYFANKEKTRYAVDCKICANKYASKLNKENPNRIDIVRKSSWKILYNITPKQYNKMFKKQKGLCAICRKNKKLCVDHDHATGQVRGLLCHSCNKGLGDFYDNVKSLKRAGDYLNGKNSGAK